MKQGKYGFRRWWISLFFLSLVLSSPETGFGANAKTYFGEGTRYLLSGQLDAAVSALSKAIGLKPNYAEAYNNRALAYYELNQYPEAEEDFYTALQLNPNDERTNNNLGIFFYNLGEYDKALVYLNQALALSKGTKPYHVDVYKNLGFIYTQRGMFKEAAKAFEYADTITSEQSKRGPDIPLKDENTSFEQRDYEQKTDECTMRLKFYEN